MSLTLTTLRVVGAKLRKDDPRGMKQFIESLQARVAESAAAGAAGGEVTPSMDSNLLQPVCMPPESCREWTGLTPASPAGRVDTPACPINLSRGRRRIASKNILCACLLKAGFTTPWNWVGRPLELGSHLPKLGTALTGWCVWVQVRRTTVHG